MNLQPRTILPALQVIIRNAAASKAVFEPKVTIIGVSDGGNYITECSEHGVCMGSMERLCPCSQRKVRGRDASDGGFATAGLRLSEEKVADLLGLLDYGSPSCS